MMKQIFALSTVLVIGLCMQSNGEEVKVADARVDKTVESDKFVVFISKRHNSDGPAGDIIVAAGKGDAPDDIKIEAAFGVYFENNKPNSGKVPVEHIATLRASKGDQPTKTFIARVDAEMYKIGLEHLLDSEKGIGVTQGVPPVAKAIEAIRVLMPSLSELKPPYIGSPMTDPQVWMEDLFKLNRAK